MTAKEKTLEAAKLLLAQRGYVVLGIRPNCDVRYLVGQIVNKCCGYDLNQPFRIIAETTWQDWAAQCDLAEAHLGRLTPSARRSMKHSDAFYRAVTD